MSSASVSSKASNLLPRLAQLLPDALVESRLSGQRRMLHVGSSFTGHSSPSAAAPHSRGLNLRTMRNSSTSTSTPSTPGGGSSNWEVPVWGEGAHPEHISRAGVSPPQPQSQAEISGAAAAEAVEAAKKVAQQQQQQMPQFGPWAGRARPRCWGGHGGRWQDAYSQQRVARMDEWVRRFEGLFNEAFVEAGMPSRVAMEGVGPSASSSSSSAPAAAAARQSPGAGFPGGWGPAEVFRGRGWGSWGPSRWGLQEGEGAFKLRLELPGVGKENVKVRVSEGNMLNIEAQQNVSEQGSTWATRFEGSLQRSLRLPEGVRPEEISARMENGVLTVTVPKNQPVLGQQGQVPAV